MESALLRARKLAGNGGSSHAADIAAVLLRDAMGRIEISARNVLSATSSPADLRLSRELSEYEPVNAVVLRRRMASRLLQAQRYVV